MIFTLFNTHNGKKQLLVLKTLRRARENCFFLQSRFLFLPGKPVYYFRIKVISFSRNEDQADNPASGHTLSSGNSAKFLIRGSICINEIPTCPAVPRSLTHNHWKKIATSGNDPMVSTGYNRREFMVAAISHISLILAV